MIMRFLSLCLLSILAVFGVSARAHADVNNFVISDFHGRYQLFNDVNGGRMTVQETIKVDFYDHNHGILRAIPVDYKGNSLDLQVVSVKRDGHNEPYATYKQANNEVLKIGRAEATITGQHTYEISYEMKNVVSFYKDRDFAEWYWDINGDQWQQRFENVSGEVILPEGWKGDELPDASCYTGSVGSENMLCRIEQSAQGYTFATTEPLAANENLTVAVPFSDNLFSPRTHADWLRDNAWQFVGIGVGLVLSALAVDQWRRWGKDYRGRGIIVPEYTVPDSLLPAEVGILYDYRVDNRDLTATLIDMAVRGYIKIYEEEKKTLGLFKSRSYTLELANDRVSKLQRYERELLQAIFPAIKKGAKQEVSAISPTTMQPAIANIRKELRTKLEKDYNFIEKTPYKAFVKIVVILLVSILLTTVFGRGWGWAIGLVMTILASLISMIFMQRRSHAGVDTFEKIKGLRLYMNTAEKDRLAMMQSVDRPYAAPSPSVDLFEKLLPYAVALGVEKSWAKQFENIYQTPPNWYSGNFSSFNTVILTNSLMSSMHTTTSNFTASSSSSSFGSGGGGFSGGGGGGGGGGGW